MAMAGMCISPQAIVLYRPGAGPVSVDYLKDYSNRI